MSQPFEESWKYTETAMVNPQIDFSQTVFTVNEAAAYLKISRAFLYKLVRQGDLQTFRLGKRTLIVGAELNRFVQSARNAAWGRLLWLSN